MGSLQPDLIPLASGISGAFYSDQPPARDLKTSGIRKRPAPNQFSFSIRNEPEKKKRKRRTDPKQSNVERAIATLDRDLSHEICLSSLRQRIGDKFPEEVQPQSTWHIVDDSDMIPFNRIFSDAWRMTGLMAHEAACERRVLILCMLHRVESAEQVLRTKRNLKHYSRFRTRVYKVLAGETGESTATISDLVSAAKRYIELAATAGPSRLLEIRYEQSYL